MNPVIRVSPQLRFAAFSLFMLVPFAAFECIVESHAPWWSLPRDAIVFWSSLVAAIAIVLAYGFFWGKRWAYRATAFFGALWILLGAWVSIRTQNTHLGFCTVGLVLYFGIALTRFKHEEGRSFFNPSIQWFERLPRAIAGITCEVSQGEMKRGFRLSRLDREGAFLFSSAEAGSHFTTRQELAGLGNSEIRLCFKDKTVTCKGKVMRLLDRHPTEGVGVGMQFCSMTPDMRKELNDFIEILRGEGYVA